MGRPAQSAWIIRVFAALLGGDVARARAWRRRRPRASRSTRARAAATAISTSRSPPSARTARVGARPTSPGSTLVPRRRPGRVSRTSAARSPGFQLVFSPSQPAGTQVASYAYVGETPPDAANTAEFFVFYNCTTRAGPAVVLRSLRNLPADRAAGAGLARAQGPDAGHRSPWCSRRCSSPAVGGSRALAAAPEPRARCAERPACRAAFRGRRALRVAAGRQVSSGAMTTAISLWLVYRRRHRAVRRVGGRARSPAARIRGATSPARRSCTSRCSSRSRRCGSRSRGSSARSARRKCGSGSRRALRLFWDEMRAIGRVRPAAWRSIAG